jgi:hypothetical protein
MRMTAGAATDAMVEARKVRRATRMLCLSRLS